MADEMCSERKDYADGPASAPSGHPPGEEAPCSVVRGRFSTYAIRPPKRDGKSEASGTIPAPARRQDSWWRAPPDIRKRRPGRGPSSTRPATSW